MPQLCKVIVNLC